MMHHARHWVLLSALLAPGVARAAPAADGETPRPATLPPVTVKAPSPPEEPPRNVLSTNPLLPLLSDDGYREVQLSYQRVLARHFSVVLTGGYAYGQQDVADPRTTLTGHAGGLRIAPTLHLPRAPGGLFLSPFGGVVGAVVSASDERSSDRGTGVGWEAGGTIGVSTVLGQVFLKLGGGVRVQHLTAKAQVSGRKVTYRAWIERPVLDLQVGWAF